MVTTGATPILALIQENIKNHPAQTIGLTGLMMGMTKMPIAVSSIAALNMIQEPEKPDFAQKQYYSNIRNAVSAQNHWNQMEGDNGKE